MTKVLKIDAYDYDTRTVTLCGKTWTWDRMEIGNCYHCDDQAIWIEDGVVLSWSRGTKQWAQLIAGVDGLRVEPLYWQGDESFDGEELRRRIMTRS